MGTIIKIKELEKTIKKEETKIKKLEETIGAIKEIIEDASWGNETEHQTPKSSITQLYEWWYGAPDEKPSTNEHNQDSNYCIITNDEKPTGEVYYGDND